MGLLDELIKYIKDASPGGLLNPELTPDNARTAAELAAFEPGLLGSVASVGLAADDVRKGNYGDAALNGLGLLPFVPAMGGMIKAVAPRAEAMRIAQKNAAKPVSEGGLGLRPDNTPMERAKAMGAEFGWAHGSPNPNITELKSSKIGAEGPGAYATNYLPESNTYAQSAEGATVYPLAVFKNKTLNSGTANPYELLGAADDVELAAKLKQMGKDSIIRTQEATPQWLIDAGGLPMPAREHYVSTNPANFRSRFAAFDPARRHEADLLGRATPEMMGLTTLAGLLGIGALKYNEQ